MGTLMPVCRHHVCIINEEDQQRLLRQTISRAVRLLSL